MLYLVHESVLPFAPIVAKNFDFQCNKLNFPALFCFICKNIPPPPQNRHSVFEYSFIIKNRTSLEKNNKKNSPWDDDELIMN